VLAAMALPVEAAETDRKIYPASSCQVSSESAGGVAFYNDQGRIYNNTANGTLTLLCPIVRDSTISDLETVSVVVRNPQPEDVHVSVWCTLYTREADGTLFKKQDRFLASSANTGWTTLTFDPPLLAVDGGYYLLVCRLPARHGDTNTGITSYSVTENVT
jgi:hypothetical protein